MYRVPEPLISLSKANFEVAAGVAAIALESGGRVIMANLHAMKTLHADGARQIKSMVEANDDENFTRVGNALLAGWASPSAATRYVKSICDAATEAQTKADAVRASDRRIQQACCRRF